MVHTSSRPSVARRKGACDVQTKSSFFATFVVVQHDYKSFAIIVRPMHVSLGFFVGGPFLAAVLAIAANYGSKQENEAGDAVRAVGKTAIEAFNFLTNVNTKYDVTGELASRAKMTCTHDRDEVLVADLQSEAAGETCCSIFSCRSCRGGARSVCRTLNGMYVL